MKPQSGERKRLAEELDELTKSMTLYTKPGTHTYTKSASIDSNGSTIDLKFGGRVITSRWLREESGLLDIGENFDSDHKISKFVSNMNISHTGIYRTVVPQDEKQRKIFLASLEKDLKRGIDTKEPGSTEAIEEYSTIISGVLRSSILRASKKCRVLPPQTPDPGGTPEIRDYNSRAAQLWKEAEAAVNKSQKEKLLAEAANYRRDAGFMIRTQKTKGVSGNGWREKGRSFELLE